MPAAGFEPAISANERPYTQALDRAVNVNDCSIVDYITDYVSRYEMWRTAGQQIEVERDREHKEEMYIWKNLIYIHHVVLVCKNTQGQTEKVQTYITRQSIRMCTYVHVGSKYYYNTCSSNNSIMELHWVTEIQDSTIRKSFVAPVMTVRAISHLLHCLLLNRCVDVLVTCVCIYCVLYCLYCVFVLFRLCIFILICFVCTSVRTTASE
jgi:hypothetical protein